MKAMEKIQHYEAEIVSMILTDPKIILTVPFDIEIFAQYREVVRVILSQLNEGQIPTVFTVTTEMRKPEIVYELGSIMRGTNLENYPSYINKLTDLVVQVKVFREFQAGYKKIINGVPVRDVVSELANNALRALSVSDKKYSYTTTEGLEALDIELAYKIESRGKESVRTGIQKIDRFLGSFYPTDMIVVGARTAQGKTAFGVTVAVNNALKGFQVGFISTEMAIEQITSRVLSQISGIEAEKFRDARFHGDDITKKKTAEHKLRQLGFRVCDKTTMKVSDIDMQARAWKMNGGLDLLVVDYLTRLHPEKSRGSQNLDMGEIAAQLKNLARNLKIPVLVLAQLNRAAVKDGGYPKMSDLRDSGIIEQEADSILLLHRGEKKTEIHNPYAPKGEKPQYEMQEENKILIDKNRHGEAGVAISVEFNKQLMKWWSYELPC